MEKTKALSQKNLFRIILALVLCIFLLVNICAGLAARKFQIKLDMTGEQLYALSPVTREIASMLNEPVDIYVVSNEKDYPAMFIEVLDRYDRLSDKINVVYVDPYANPVFIDHYRQLGYSLSEGDVVVDGVAGVRQASSGDMLVYSEGEVVGIKLEQQLSSALVYVNNPRKWKAGFTTGHNERTTTALENIFYDNNFSISTVYLSAAEVEDVDILVIASPARDFTPEEASALEAYLTGGGKAMLFLEPGVVEYPHLEALLADWNLGVGNNVVMEQRAYVSDNPLNIIPQFGAHEINYYFADNRYFVVMPSSRTVDILNGNLGAVDTRRVLTTTTEAYAKEGGQYATTQKEPEDETGPFVLAATSRKEVMTRDGVQTAEIFLAGSRYLYADDIMGTPSYANREFLAQVVNYMTDNTVTITIEPKTLAAPVIGIRMDHSILLGILFAVVFPLGALATGIAVCMKRKNL